MASVCDRCAAGAGLTDAAPARRHIQRHYRRSLPRSIYLEGLIRTDAAGRNAGTQTGSRGVSPTPRLPVLPARGSECSVPARDTEERDAGALQWGRVARGAVAASALLLSLAGPLLPAHAAGLVVPGIVGDDELREGFTSGLLLVLVSEIGDKTFFVAMLLAAREAQSGRGSAPTGTIQGESGGLGGRDAVFLGTFFALAIMTLISCGIGLSFHSLDELLKEANLSTAGAGALQTLLKFPIDDLLAVVLLTFFGATSLFSALEGDEGEGNVDEEGGELLDARLLLQEQDKSASPVVSSGALLLSTFTLVFAAEWGDRSFLATIALAAAYPPAGVVGGAVAGHGLATALAVGGGTVLANYISERAMSLAGGVLFLTFAAATMWDLIESVN